MTLAGKRFGQLTVVRPRLTPDRQWSDEWECICTCGGWAIRRASYLLRCGDVNSMCGECLQRARSEYFRHAHRRMVSLRAGRASVFGRGFISSYVASIEANAIFDIAEALRDEFGQCPEEGFSDDQIDPYLR